MGSIINYKIVRTQRTSYNQIKADVSNFLIYMTNFIDVFSCIKSL